MTRETAETQRTERAVARNGRIRFGDGAVRFAVGRMGPAGRSAVSTGGGVRTAGQPGSRTEWRQNSRSEGQKAGFVRETEKRGRGTELRRERAGPACGFGKRRGGKTDVRLPDRKNGAETNMGPGGWRMVLK